MSDPRVSMLTMPKWGMTMTEGRVVKWLVPEGANVAAGDELLDVETEKIANAVEAPVAGCCAGTWQARARRYRCRACSR